jgi:hypothetical protein
MNKHLKDIENISKLAKKKFFGWSGNITRKACKAWEDAPERQSIRVVGYWFLFC